MLVVLTTALAAMAIFVVVVTPEKAQILIGMATVLAGVIGGVLALLKTRGTTRAPDDEN